MRAARCAQDAVVNSQDGSRRSVTWARVVNGIRKCKDCGDSLSVRGRGVTHNEMAKSVMWLDVGNVSEIVEQTEKVFWRQCPKLTNFSLIK